MQSASVGRLVNGRLPALSFDCSGAQASVALTVDGLGFQAARGESGRSQASDLLPMAEALLQAEGVQWSDLGGLVLVNGPGSFTGLRVAAGLVQGLARARNLPVALISGFEVLAFAQPLVPNHRPLAVCLDARLGEWFEGPIEWSSAGLPRLGVGSSVVAHPRVGALIDPALDALGSMAESALRLVCQRLSVGEAQHWVEACDAQPLYVRDRVAQTTEERRLQAALRLEPMRREDLASVMVIENQAYPFPWTSGNFLDSIEAGYEMRRLVDQDAVVGHCVWMVVADEAHLLNFTVSPARQRRGLGQWMLRKLFSHWEAQGLVRCLLEVRPTNLPALGLYKRNGFDQIGLRKGYYPNGPEGREDAWVFARSLGDSRSKTL
jgi:tRNA threonylcarbamoyl adenosine modification protein YeaZ/ribosomal-protein-alanine acetyltransferase